jgi:hypothetical protein
MRSPEGSQRRIGETAKSAAGDVENVEVDPSTRVVGFSEQRDLGAVGRVGREDPVDSESRRIAAVEGQSEEFGVISELVVVTGRQQRRSVRRERRGVVVEPLAPGRQAARATGGKVEGPDRGL